MASPWQPGETVGNYVLMIRIAVGGMAEIWLARQVGLKGFERVVVIKRMSDSLNTDPAFVELFLDEARIAAQLSHPHIVQIYELGSHNGAYYIVMEYLHGEDLSTLVRGARKAKIKLPFSYSARIVANAAAGLASAHATKGNDGSPLNLVHRDISPQNIFISYDGAVKVLDFGVAKATSRASAATASGQIRGKYSYMAPEQARAEDVDARADVWALGVVLFESITSTRLFSFKNDAVATIKAVQSDEPVPLASTRNPEVPAALDEIVDKALARNRDKRYPTALAFQLALEGWLRTQADAPVGPDLQNFMQQVFADRAKSKGELIETVRRGNVAAIGTPRTVRPPTERSMPGISTPSALVNIPKKSKTPLFAGLGAAAVAIAVGLYFLLAGSPSGTLVIDTFPAGAEVSVDGKPAGKAPLSLDAQTVGEHEVSAFMTGFATSSRKAKVTSGGRTEVELQLVAEPKKVAVADPPKDPGPGPTVVPVPTTPDPPPVVRTQPVGKGTLTLETDPWTRVSENGKSLGETPLIQISMTAGKHRLKLVNEDKKISEVIEVQVIANKPTVKRLKF